MNAAWSWSTKSAASIRWDVIIEEQVLKYTLKLAKIQPNNNQIDWNRLNSITFPIKKKNIHERL